MARVVRDAFQAVVVAITATAVACAPPQAATPAPICPTATVLPADWKPTAFSGFGVSIRVPPTYRRSVLQTVEAEGRAFHTVELEFGMIPGDTMPPWFCAPTGRHSACANPSEYCVITVERRPVYLEAAVLDSASDQGLTVIPGTDAYEFRAYVVSAAWRTGPVRWAMIRGLSRDAAGQREMFSALRSLSFKALD